MAEEKKRSTMVALALIISVVALFLTVQDRLSSKRFAVETINNLLTETVIPATERGQHEDMVRTLYDLKHVVTTLEQIKEASQNEEVGAMVDTIKKQVEALSVKIFVHE